MDIALKFKRAMATVATIALFASTASVAIAQTFNDVPTDAWYYSYVEQLVDDGVIDAADLYRPADALNRAELVKIAITAIDGLAGYEAPATATFDDVSTDAWYYDYVEAAVQLGIVNGYTDAFGNLTGYFGPADTVNRAAATKILVNAFSVPTTLTPASVFPDVQTADWYYDYVITAYNQSVLDGYDNGYFGPADPVTRAQVAKLTVLAQSPVLRADGDEEGEEEVEEGTSEGDLEISLNDNTPASSTLPFGATSVNLLDLDFTAADDSVTIDSIVFTRGGVGSAADWESVYVYLGSERLRSGRTISNDTNTATFTSLGVQVSPGTTTTLSLVGDVAVGATPNNQHYFYVAAAGDITSNAQSVAGDFPTVGNLFTIGGVGVSNATIATAGSISNPILGSTDAEVANFKLTAGINDVALHSIALYHGGSISAGDLVNFKLYQSTSLLAETSAIGSNDLLTFVLDTPFNISKSQNRNFRVHADIIGGKSIDTIKFYLDEATDIVVIDQQYGFGCTLTNTLGSANVAAVNLQAGDLTFADNGPSSSDIASNSTNNAFFNFSAYAARNLDIKDYDIIVEQVATSDLLGLNTGASTPGFTAVKGTSTGNLIYTDTDATNTLAVNDIIKFANGVYCKVDLLTSDTLFSCVPLNSGIIAATATFVQTWDASTSAGKLKELRLVDIDTSSTIYNKSTPDGYTLASDDFVISAGEMRHLGITLDIDTTTAPGNVYKAGFNFNGSNYVKDADANEYLAASNVVGGNLLGKNMTITVNSLNLAQAATPVSQNYVINENNVSLIGAAVTAGNAGDIKMTKFKARLHADSANAWAGAAPYYGDTAANTLVETVSLYKGSDLISGPKSLTLVGNCATGCYYEAEFNNISQTVPKGTTETYTVKANLKGLITAASFLSAEIIAADIEAEDGESNTVTPLGNVNSGQAVVATINTSGNLYIVESGSPDDTIVEAGNPDPVTMSKYKFTAQNEAFKVQQVDVVFDTDNDFTNADLTTTNNVTKVTIKYLNEDGDEQTQSTTGITGGVASFSNMTMFVPKDDNGYLTVYADINTIDGGATSGAAVSIGLSEIVATNTFKAEGVGSGDTLTIATVNLTTANGLVNDMYVRKTVPTVKKATSGLSSNLTGGQLALYGFTVSASNGADVNWKRVNIDLSGVLTAGTIQSFKFFRGTTDITADVTIVDAAAADLTLAVDRAGLVNAGMVATVEFTGVKEANVPKNTNQTYYLKANVAGVGTGDSISAYIPDDLAVVANNDYTTIAGGTDNWIWSDTSYIPHSTGVLSTDWTNGFVVDNLSTEIHSMNY